MARKHSITQVGHVSVALYTLLFAALPLAPVTRTSGRTERDSTAARVAGGTSGGGDATAAGGARGATGGTTDGDAAGDGATSSIGGSSVATSGGTGAHDGRTIGGATSTDFARGYAGHGNCGSRYIGIGGTTSKALTSTRGTGIRGTAGITVGGLVRRVNGPCH